MCTRINVNKQYICNISCGKCDRFYNSLKFQIPESNLIHKNNARMRLSRYLTSKLNICDNTLIDKISKTANRVT